MSPRRRRATRRPQTVVKASAPEDLLALAAHQIGYHPHESLVLVSLRGPRRRTGLVLRVDLAPFLDRAADSPGELPHLARQLLAPIGRDGASAVAVLLVSRCEGAGEAHRALFTALEGACAAAGVPVAEGALVGERRLYPLGCDDACCPPEGRPLRDVAASAVGAALVVEGSALAPDRAAVVAELVAAVAPAPPQERAEVERLARGRGALGTGPAGGTALRAVRGWFELLDAATALLAEEPPDGGGPDAEDAAALLDPRRAAALLGDLEHLLVRDVVLVAVVPGAREVLALPGDASPRHPDARHPDAVLADRLLDALDAQLGATSAGDPVELDAAEALLQRAARLAPAHLRAAPIAVLAYWAWWRGSTLAAGALAEEAVRADPGYSLGPLVRQLAEGGVPPGWVPRGRPAGSGEERWPTLSRRS